MYFLVVLISVVEGMAVAVVAVRVVRLQLINDLGETTRQVQLQYYIGNISICVE